jgi:hypothetical protein
MRVRKMMMTIKETDMGVILHLKLCFYFGGVVKSEYFKTWYYHG